MRGVLIHPILLFVFFVYSDAKSKYPTCTHEILDSRAGMFSNMLGVLCAISLYGSSNIKISWKNPLYLDSKNGNVWSQYLRPISNCSIDSSTVKKTMAGWDCKLKNHGLNLTKAASFIKLNSKMEQKYSMYLKHLNISSADTIGLHIRNTDRITSPEDIKRGLRSIDVSEFIKIIYSLNLSHYKMFVATDSSVSLHKMKSTFPNQIKHIAATRSDSAISLHHGKLDRPYDLGESAILDAWMLSKTGKKIFSVSNLSLFSLLKGRVKTQTLLMDRIINNFDLYKDIFPCRHESGSLFMDYSAAC